MRRRVPGVMSPEVAAVLASARPPAALAQQCRQEIARRFLVGLEREFSAYRFRPVNEADLQEQLLGVLAGVKNVVVRSEVRAQNGRYDVEVETLGVRVVLELKTQGSASAVERQAQRYAMTDGVDAVAIVTTSNRLAHSIGREPTIGGKPLVVIALRTI